MILTKIMSRAGILAAALGLCYSLAAVAHAPGTGDEGQLGRVDFGISCNGPAQVSFNEAVAWLHSFEYERAGATFLEVLGRDASCAMAHWGMAMSLWHQLWVTSPSPADLAKGAEHVRHARALAPDSGRESRYIEAIGALYSDYEKLNHRSRTLAYPQARAELHASHPEGGEASVYYALPPLAPP